MSESGNKSRENLQNFLRFKRPKFHMGEMELKYEHVNKHFKNVSETIKVCQVAFFIRIPYMVSQLRH